MVVYWAETWVACWGQQKAAPTADQWASRTVDMKDVKMVAHLVAVMVAQMAVQKAGCWVVQKVDMRVEWRERQTVAARVAWTAVQWAVY